jgi:putative transposase
MHLSLKLRIFPTEDQEKILWDLSEKCRLIYNFALQERIENWKLNKDKPKEEKEYITYTDQQNNLISIKNKYPEYKWVYSKVLQTTLRRLDQDFKSFFALWKKKDTKARRPNFKGKKRFNALCYNQSGFKLIGNNIKFSHKHPSKIPLIFELPKVLEHKYQEIEKVKQVDLFLRKKVWYVSIVYEVKVLQYKDNGSYQSIDLGISNIVSAVNIYGKFVQIKNNRADLYWRKKVAEVQSKRDRCKKYSNRWNWLNDKLIKMKTKCSNQLKDFQHKTSNKIVNNTKANTIIVGDLNLKKMAKRKKGTGSSLQNKKNRTLSHSLQNTGTMGRFVEFLTYKAELVGKRVMKINESYTSQKCAKCGNKISNGLYNRHIKCSCGLDLDRDLNSAINIMVKFLSNKSKHEDLLQECSLNEQSFLSNYKGFITINSPNSLALVNS